MTLLDHLVGYALVAAMWAIICIGMSLLSAAEDKKFSRSMVRGFWLSPVWLFVLIMTTIRCLCWLWRKAEWGK